MAESEITFGVEFEFLVDTDKLLSLRPEEANAAPISSMPLPSTSPRIKAIKVANIVKNRLEEAGLSPVQVTKELYVIPRDISELECTTWVVKKDITVKKSIGDIQYAGMEVTSPVLPNTSKGYEELAKAVKAIRQVETVLFNESCGLHVHVGRGDAGIELLPLQKFASLLLLGGEWILDNVHPARRRGRWPCYRNSTDSRLARLNIDLEEVEARPDEAGAPWLRACDLENPSRRIKNQVKYLWKAKSSMELGQWLKGFNMRRLAYDVRQQGAASENRRFEYKRTIEFRQADGDLSDEGFPIAWVKVATGMLAWAFNADLETFRSTIQEVTGAIDQEGQVSKLLKSIGIPEDVISTWNLTLYVYRVLYQPDFPINLGSTFGTARPRNVGFDTGTYGLPVEEYYYFYDQWPIGLAVSRAGQHVLGTRQGRPTAHQSGRISMAYAVPGGSKLVTVDLATDTVTRTYTLPLTVHYKGSYMNNLRFDLPPTPRSPGAGIACIFDSGNEARNRFIMVDLARGRAGASQISIRVRFESSRRRPAIRACHSTPAREVILCGSNMKTLIALNWTSAAG
ncbi:hypothetical protein DL767_008236 [Monosporascus sp. MG133]|nr:hypothetical protein DL767_008236 [Monosporascus sp. MG133]